jgi:quinol monooxygenase YgiN
VSQDKAMTTSTHSQPAETVSFIVYLPTRPEAREKMRKVLFDVVETMAKEPDFINTWVHEDLNDPNMIVNYETWACSREHFIEHHLKKPYRQAYEKALPELLSGERRLVFLKGIGAYPGKTPS